MIYLNFPELLSEKLGNWLYFYFFVKCILSDIWSFFYKLDKKDPKNEKGFLKRNRKKTMFKVLRLSILDNHELMLSLESTYLINPIRPVFTFRSCDLKLKLSWIISIYAQVNWIGEVIF